MGEGKRKKDINLKKTCLAALPHPTPVLHSTTENSAPNLVAFSAIMLSLLNNANNHEELICRNTLRLVNAINK